MNNNINIAISADYYFYYMVSLYYLIHEYECQWEFCNINDKTPLNGTNLKFDEFARNKYLNEYKENKVGLAEDIVEKGMYFPYFIYGLKDEQPDENTIKLALGKHRFYSKLLYQEKYNSMINKDYLFIYVPNHPENIIEMLPKDLNFRYYLVSKKGMQIEERRFYDQKSLMSYFDITGGILSNFLINSDIPANPILNDKKLFEQFINAPLDKNNILFTTYLEIKNYFETKRASEED